MSVNCCIKIINQTLLTHVVDNFARSVINAKLFIKYVYGANIAGFIRVGKAMLAMGII